MSSVMSARRSRSALAAGSSGERASVALLRSAIATATRALSPDDPAARALRDFLADITDDMTAR